MTIAPPAAPPRGNGLPHCPGPAPAAHIRPYPLDELDYSGVPDGTVNRKDEGEEPAAEALRVPPGRTGLRTASILPEPMRTDHAAKNAGSGGLWAGAGQRPRCARIFPITSGCSMTAMMRIPLPHRGHTNGFPSYTCVIRRAQARLATDVKTSST